MKKSYSVLTSVILGCVLASSPARADVSPKGKGIVGGGLLGGELVTFTMGAIGVDSGLAYVLGGVLGAGAGAAGGYAIEQNVSSAEAPSYMLAGGLALIIPATIVALNATAFQPPEFEEEIDDGLPDLRTPVARASKHPKKQAAAGKSSLKSSLVDVRSGEWGLGVPNVQVKPLYNQREQLWFGEKQGTEVKIPVVRAAF